MSSIVLAVIAAGAFVLVERRSDHPMVDPALFADSAFGTLLRIGTCINVAITASSS